jgi:hypothetical protein
MFISKIKILEDKKFRIILGTLILAVKFNEDDYFSNEYYSKVGGVSNAEFNNIEYESFFLIENKLYISEEDYLKYKNYLDNYEEEV